MTRSSNGDAQLETRDASFAAGDGRFASAEELTRHLCQIPGAQPVDGGVRGSMSRKGSYTRRGAGAVTFGDVVLDEVTSASGAVIIGDRRIDVTEPGALGQAPGAPPIVPADSQLVYTGQVNGTERWAAPDGSEVQFRAPSGATLTFHAWKRSYWFGYWSMGASVTADAENYEAAIIDSNYYMTVPERPTCEIVKVGQATDSNNSYFDEWQWGWNSQQPDRVASWCRAQWNGARFADLVTAGSGCDRYKDDQWPTGFPPDWPPLPTGIEVSPAALTMTANGIGINAAASTNVLNHTANDVSVQVQPPADDNFSWPSGAFTAPAFGGFPITVSFGGGDAAGDYYTTVDIVAGTSQAFAVPVTATVIDTGPPK
jgi:hypothetical protein